MNGLSYNTNRILWADSLKGILMLLVVFGHAIQAVFRDDCETTHVWNMIYSFHMPAFMAISGWLSYKPKKKGSCERLKNIGIYIGRRFSQLMIPYFAWSVIYIIIVTLLTGEYSIDKLLAIFLSPDDYFWFLWVLFWISLIFRITQEISSYCIVKEELPLAILCLSTLAAMVIFDIRILGFQFISYYLLFYTLGYFLNKNGNGNQSLSTPHLIGIILLSIMWIFLSWGWSMHDLPTWVPEMSYVPKNVLLYSYRGATAFIGTMVLFKISPLYINNSTTINLLLCRFGSQTLGVYVIHLTIIGLLCSLFGKIGFHGWGTIAILTISAALLSYFITEMISKNKLISKILLGKLS